MEWFFILSTAVQSAGVKVRGGSADHRISDPLYFWIFLLKVLKYHKSALSIKAAITRA